MKIENTYTFAELRDKLNLSQGQISKKSGMPQPRISEFERGNKNFTLKVIQQMATAIGYPAIILETGDPEKPEVRFLVVNPQDFDGEIEQLL